MANNDFVKREDEQFAAQIVNFAAKLPNYAQVLNISPEQLAQAKKDADLFVWVLHTRRQYDTHAKNWRAYKDSARYGADNELLGGVPNAPILPPQPTLVEGNIEARFRKLVAYCKVQKNYTEAIGLDLGVIAPKAAAIDFSEKKPTFTVELSAGCPLLKWKKDGMEGIEIYVSTNGSDFIYLDFDTTPNYIDKRTPLPAYGEVAVWKYRCIYRYKGEQIGQWSEEVAVVLRGI